MVGKVCVIGGGPSGLGVLCWFAKLKREGKVRIRKTHPTFVLHFALRNFFLYLSLYQLLCIYLCICLCISSFAILFVSDLLHFTLYLSLYQPLCIFICICLCICLTSLSSSREKVRWDFVLREALKKLAFLGIFPKPVFPPHPPPPSPLELGTCAPASTRDYF